MDVEEVDVLVVRRLCVPVKKGGVCGKRSVYSPTGGGARLDTPACTAV